MLTAVDRFANERERERERERVCGNERLPARK